MSSKPGKTQLLNVFATEDGATLVDLPGYGYASSASQADRAAWQRRMHAYLLERDELVLTLLLVDGEVGPAGSDVEMLGVAARPRRAVPGRGDQARQGQRLEARAPQARPRCRLRPRPSATSLWVSAEKNVGIDRAARPRPGRPSLARGGRGRSSVRARPPPPVRQVGPTRDPSRDPPAAGARVPLRRVAHRRDARSRATGWATPRPIFALSNGFLGIRGTFEEGRPVDRARRLPQRVPRDVAHRARRGGVRVRPDRARPSSTAPTRRSSSSTSTTNRCSCRPPGSPSTSAASTSARASCTATSTGRRRRASRCASARARLVSLQHRHLGAIQLRGDGRHGRAGGALVASCSTARTPRPLDEPRHGGGDDPRRARAFGQRVLNAREHVERDLRHHHRLPHDQLADDARRRDRPRLETDNPWSVGDDLVRGPRQGRLHRSTRRRACRSASPSTSPTTPRARSRRPSWSTAPGAPSTAPSATASTRSRRRSAPTSTTSGSAPTSRSTGRDASSRPSAGTCSSCCRRPRGPRAPASPPRG